MERRIRRGYPLAGPHIAPKAVIIARQSGDSKAHLGNLARLLYKTLSTPIQEAEMNIGKDDFRLSRVSHPRATFWAILLLTLVFLGFGLAAEAFVPPATLAGSGIANPQFGELAATVLRALIPGY